MVNTRKHLKMITIVIAMLVLLILVQVAAAVKPNMPTLIAPLDESEITTLTPTFTWSKFSDPDGDHQSEFNIAVWEEPGFDTKGTLLVLDYYESTPNSSVTPNEKDYKKVLENGKWYHWHVKVKDNNGEWSDWANNTEYLYMDFRINIPLPSPPTSTLDFLPTPTVTAVPTPIPPKTTSSEDSVTVTYNPPDTATPITPPTITPPITSPTIAPPPKSLLEEPYVIGAIITATAAIIVAIIRKEKA